MPAMSDRAEYVKGLLALADLLERHADLPLPTHREVNWLLFGDPGEKQTAAQVIRRVPGDWAKVPYGDRGDKTLFGFTNTLHGLRLGITVYRHTVCERVVVGTEPVTAMVPDPSVQVPLVEVTKDVEIVRWECRPLLSDVDAPASPPPFVDGFQPAAPVEPS
jgi:hypothetical protein